METVNFCCDSSFASNLDLVFDYLLFKHLGFLFVYASFFQCGITVLFIGFDYVCYVFYVDALLCCVLIAVCIREQVIVSGHSL